jgi:glycosyltransferase involved in cell wall biosynthesis
LNRIAILHLLNHFGSAGIGRAVQVRVQNLGQENFTWHVGAILGLDHPAVTGGEQTIQHSLKDEFGRLGTQVIDFSSPLRTSGLVVKKIREYVRNHQIQIVHTHSPRTVLAATMALPFTKETAHLATEHLLYSEKDRRWGLFYMLLDRFSLYLPDHIIAVSQKMYDHIAKLPGLDPRRITMIQNAVDCDAFYQPNQRNHCRLEFGLNPESQVFGYTGRIDHVKRLDLLLESFVSVLLHHPHARLMIIGKGQLRPKLETLATRLGISHAVIWTGFRQDIPRLLSAIDIYIQPSINEGLPKSVLEALAAGKPVIATNVGGTSEVVIDGKTGILISPGSSTAIETAMVDLLDHPEKRLFLAEAGRSHVIQKFGVQRMVDAYENLYHLLCSYS